MEDINRTQDITIAASQSGKEREYWLNKLSGPLHKTQFPHDFEPVEPGNHNKSQGSDRIDTKTVTFEIPGGLYSQIMKLSNGSDSRIHMIFIAAVSALLHRCTGNKDIIIGVPVDKQEIEGEFVNMAVALRNVIGPRMSFRELLLSVRNTVLEAAENQNYPLEVLLYDLDINIIEQGFPLFDVAVLLENIQDKKYLQHLDLSIIFSFLRSHDGIRGTVEYKPQLYHEASITKITRYLHVVLERCLSDVNTKLGDIEILLTEEKKKLLLDFNQTQWECSSPKTVDLLFSRQVELTPNHRAVIHWRGMNGDKPSISLTYTELNEKANQMAWILKSKGVKPGVIVCIMVDDPIALVTSILGILKAGGTYLPISSRYPEERIRYMLKDSQARFFIKGNNLSREYIDNQGIEIMNFNNLSLESTPVEHFPSISRPNDTAYIIYTSGTTGKPRGVMVEHDSVVNTLTYRKEVYQLNPEVTALQLFSPAFDGFITSFFTPIVAGAAVVLLSEEDVMDISRVKAAIIEYKVTHFISIPSLYQALLEELTPEETSSLNVITLAGDKVSSNLLDMTAKKNPHIEIAQEYGVTEAAVMSTLYRNQQKDNQLKIGSPTGNTRIYIVDEELHPQPLGSPGELCLAGKGISRGYLNNPEKTREKFIECATLPEKMIYRTGDLARWLPDGNIQFLGRIDSQVKIMGFRIELAEIESQLLKHKDIKEAIVVEKESAKGRKYLCAYVVPFSPNTPPTDSQLREFLGQLIPDYMIPAYFILMEQFPLTANGKIDKNRLPKPDDVINIQYIPPKNEIQEKLAEIWQTELNLERVGINDNYFNIGGDSIKSVKLINIINKKLIKNLKIADLYSNNTIARLAQVIDEGEAEIPPTNMEYENARQKLENMKNMYIKGVKTHAG